MKVKSWLAAIIAHVGIGTVPIDAADVEDVSYSWQAVPFGGPYRFDFERQRWIQLFDRFAHDDGELMGVLSIAVDIAGDWHEPGVVYIAPGARGLMVGRPNR